MQVDYSVFKCLIVGCGSIGKRHLTVLRELGLKNISISDTDATCLRECKEKFSVDKAYADFHFALNDYAPNIVFILTPTKMHIDMAIEAIKTGAHVFIEKPLSNSSNGVEELKKLSIENGCKVMVGFCMRYHSVLLKARALISSGTIGRLISIRAHMGENFPSVQPRYKTMYYAQYSGAFELVHDLDLAIWFANETIIEVFGVYGSYSDIGIEAPDVVEMILKFDNKKIANVHLDFFQIPRRRFIELIGTDGIISVDFSTWDKANLSIYRAQTEKWEQKEFLTSRNDMFRDEDKDFFEAIIGKKPVMCSIDEALKSLIAIESIYKPY